jgi:hypothetical protein
MQTVIEVVCSKGASLRDAIADDRHFGNYEFEILKEKQPGRRPGWTKIRSTDSSRQGTINIAWNSATHTLTCRVVNRGKAKPSLVIGDLVCYLLDRHRRRIKLLLILGK